MILRYQAVFVVQYKEADLRLAMKENLNALLWVLSALFTLVPLNYCIDFCSWWLVGYTWANWILYIESIHSVTSHCKFIVWVLKKTVES